MSLFSAGRQTVRSQRPNHSRVRRGYDNLLHNLDLVLERDPSRRKDHMVVESRLEGVDRRNLKIIILNPN
jgi:hypothetical protein